MYPIEQRYLVDETHGEVTMSFLNTNMPYETNNTFEAILKEFIGGKIPPKYNYPQPKKIIFQPPATIVYWEDGDKTVVKCMSSQQFDEQAGYAAAFMKKVYGTHAAFKSMLKEKSVTKETKKKE